VVDSSVFEVYVDGAFSASRKAMGAGWVIYSPDGGLYSKGSATRIQEGGTSFMAELVGLVEALKQLPNAASAVIYTDNISMLDILAGIGRRRKKNVAMFAEVDDAMKELGNLDFRYVQGHAGIRGNELAHELAAAALAGKREGGVKGPA
jgi:ribonuclease HI